MLHRVRVAVGELLGTGGAAAKASAKPAAKAKAKPAVRKAKAA